MKKPLNLAYKLNKEINRQIEEDIWTKLSGQIANPIWGKIYSDLRFEIGSCLVDNLSTNLVRELGNDLNEI